MRNRWILALALSFFGCWAEPWPGVGAPVCEDTCRYANDGECDDGGPGAVYSVCGFGTDCGDCGIRGLRMDLARDRRGTSEDCPASCPAEELCVADYGCLPRCAEASECSSGCCAAISSEASACSPAVVCGE